MRAEGLAFAQASALALDKNVDVDASKPDSFDVAANAHGLSIVPLLYPRSQWLRELRWKSRAVVPVRQTNPGSRSGLIASLAFPKHLLKNQSIRNA
jgi:hypothetical protein